MSEQTEDEYLAYMAMGLGAHPNLSEAFDLTPEQEDILASMVGEPPQMTAEEARIENIVAIFEGFSDSLHEILDRVDELNELGVMDMSDFRDAIAAALERISPEEDERSLEDLS